jgi:hypothetical protein
MLAERITSTLRFFDLQSLPLTAFEVHQYLIADVNNLRTKLDERFEMTTEASPVAPPVHYDTILTQLHILTREGKILSKNGYYALAGKESIIADRLRNYLHGLKREKLVQRYLVPTRHIPFVRGIALAGSQALGQQRDNSDIDLLIITDPRRMWTARTLLSAWFHLFGVRRYGDKIANRFCLNHYLANPREVDAERNLYKAMEYTKLRSIGDGSQIRKFQRANIEWIKQFFPNISFPVISKRAQSGLQKFLEQLLDNRVGDWLEQRLGKWQQSRIRQDQFVFVRRDELSFHPESKHTALLRGFFQ